MERTGARCGDSAIRPPGRQSSQHCMVRVGGAMRDFLINVTRYPRYLVAFSLGVINSVVEPLARRRSNPVTAVALVGALVSGLVTLTLVLRAMVNGEAVA